MGIIAVYKDPQKKKLQIFEIIAAIVLIAVTFMFAPKAIQDINNFNDALEYHNMGHPFLHSGDEASALQSFNKALECYPELYETREEIASVYQCRNDFAKAEATYHEAIKVMPGESRLHFSLSELYMLEKKFDEALKEAKIAAVTEPHNLLYKKHLERCEKAVSEGVPERIGSSPALEHNPETCTNPHHNHAAELNKANEAGGATAAPTSEAK